VRRWEHFCINMLAAGQEGISRLFATKKSHEEEFARLGYRHEHGAPVIDGSVAWLVCGLDSELERGDHIVAIGGVVAGATSEDAEPLLFHRGVYSRLPVPDRRLAGTG
jgi:3-hydroxy-9,10-secoandrosta-1,3,5(10)-triene-9,17-dione monooxygenase reductase component